MRIGIFSDRYLPQIDGVSFSIESFRVELEKLGHEVYIFAPRPSWRYKERSSRIIRFPAVKGLFFEDYLLTFFSPPQAVKQIDKLKLDIIHYQTPGQIGLLGAYYAIHKGIPLVTTYHTDLYEYAKHYRSTLPGVIALSLLAPAITGGGMAEYRQSLSSITPERSIDKWNQKIIVRMLTMLHNHCDLVITPSAKTQKQLLSWKTTSRVVALPTGVEIITTKKGEVARIRQKYDLNPSDKLVIFVGRMGTEKNVSLLIRAFSKVAESIDDSKLLLVGQGDDLEHFKDQAAQSGFGDRIIFTGYVDHSKLGALYRISNVFAFASLADTQGMVINEAARVGLPIVMVDREISQVVVNKVNGFYARNTSSDLAAKIVRILNNPKLQHRMAEQSVELAAEVTPGKQAAKLLRLYKETIEQHRETAAKIPTNLPKF